MELFNKKSVLILVLILFSGSLFLIGLGAMPLTDPDEVFYAETAKEMLERGEFLTPYIFSKPQFEKPPLYYWLVILGFRAFGVNEFSARVASSILGIFGVIGIYLLGKTLVNKRTGFFAGIILATSIIYLVLSRACVTDIALGVFTLYAFLFFFYGYLNKLGRLKWYMLSALFLGLSVLTKGPVGVFLPVLIVTIYLILAKETKRIKEMPILSGLLVFLAVSLPWYLLAYKVHGSAFIDEFFGFHNVIRFLHPEHKIGDVFYYYVPVVIAGFLPWSAFLPLGIWQVFTEGERRIRKTNLFLVTWFLVIFVFFSISRTKLPTYIFPLYPALALLVARVWDAFLDKALTQKMNKFMNISLYLFIALIAGGMTGLYILSKRKYPTVALPALVVGILLTLLMAFFVVLLLRRKYLTSFIVFVISFIIVTFPISYIILPELGKYESSKTIAEKVLTLIKPEEKLGAETQFRRGVAFYTQREDIPDVHRHHIITKFLKEKERVWCIIKEKNHIQLYTDEKLPYDKPTYIVYRLGKKVLVTNKRPSDGKFLKIRTSNDPR